MTLVETTAASRAAQRVISPGGIEAWLVEEHAIPLIAMEVAFLGGATQDADAKAGTAALMAGLLDEGAGDLDADSFQERLADRAIEIHFHADRDSWHAALKTLARHADGAFDLFRLALTRPRFDDDAMERVREQMFAGLRHEAKDPESMASRAFFAHACAGHPYAHPVRGTLESLPGIGRDDVVTLHRASFARDNLIVAVVGAIDAATLGRRLDEVFGDLPAEAAMAAVTPTTVGELGSHAIVDLDVPQSVLRFGLPGIGRRDDDYMAGYVVNHILGGGSFTSRLFQEVREKRGLAYSVWTSLHPLRHCPLFMGGTATKNERAAESLSVIKGEMARLMADGPSQEELAKAKQFLIGSYALHFDTSTKIARQLVQIAMDGLGIDYIDRRNELVAAVTMDDSHRVARRLFGQGDPLVVVAGRPQGL
ncbi:M16 family metallopeptidase [Chelatococcus sp. GCM10030263]|uniref:M16 family metallopeptidase n=1 Tax=Chelatococcus sp. GCM10030263 TaxID=3273387 RepID=UPI003620CFB8